MLDGSVYNVILGLLIMWFHY